MRKHQYLLFYLLTFSFMVSLKSGSLESMKKIRNGERNLCGAILCGSNLSYRNLSNVIFRGANLRCARLYNSNFYRSIFCHAIMCEASLICANASYADFKNAVMLGANLNGATIIGANFENAKMHDVKLDGTTVTGANFKCARGLTLEQKEYLREHGAINVPVDFVYEPDDSEVGHEVAPKKSFKKRLLGFFTRKYKRYFQTQNASTQTTF